MFYNLKFAFRNLRRNGLYSWINITGLAVSIMATVLILLWVQDEWNYDRFYANSDRIYRSISHNVDNGKENYTEINVVPLARTAKAEIPGVEDACTYGYNWNIGYLEGNTGYKCTGGDEDFAFADSTFFNIFNMEFIEGDARAALNTPQGVVLTEKLARLLFGDGNAVGSMLKDNNGNEYHVSAVVRRPANNTVFQFKALFSFERSSRKSAWSQWTSYCFLKLKPGVDPSNIGTQLSEMHERHSTDYKHELPYILQPLSQAHLYAPDGSETGMKNVRLFTIIAFALLGIACINYVNLVTARMNKRGKEISLKKIVGAGKFRLFIQMMGESSLLFYFALFIAQLLLFLTMPSFKTITGKQFDFNPFSQDLWLLYLGIFGFVTLLAGIYPAIKLSSFRPEISRSKVMERKSVFSLRKLLVVLQFACSAALIFSTIAMDMQQHFMRTKSPGYERENIFTVDMMANRKSYTYLEALKHELEQQPEIAGVTASEQNVMNVGNFTDINWSGKPEGMNFSTAYMGIDHNFIKTLDVQMAAGHEFTGAPADSGYFLVNEAAVKQMGLTDPLNTMLDISWMGNDKGKKPIAGVVKDFHFRHMHEAIGPIVMYLPEVYWTLYVKAAAGKTHEAVAVTERIWKKYDSEYPFVYKFMDEMFDAMYKGDTRAGTLFNSFAIIAILVSCLGLFGLVTYTAETKTKEIGIRKVLGASVKNIVYMLSKEFLMLIGFSMLIAFPLAYYWLDNMLRDYAYRIGISWWIFATAGLILTVLTLLTVGWKAIRSATANPVSAIKAE